MDKEVDMETAFETLLEKLEKKRLERVEQLRLSCTKSMELVNKIKLKEIEESIEIVKQAAAEYNNGWIPCSVAMPEERDSMFAKLKGTRKWNDSMFEKISEEVNVTISDENGDKVTTHAYTTDGKWKCDLLRFHKGYSVIAWQPLQEPYNQKFIQECANPVSKEEREELNKNIRTIPIGTYYTNADCIRSMSDEELAEFMANKGGYIACNQCDFFNRDEEKCESPSGWLCTKGYAEALIHNWLQSEVEE